MVRALTVGRTREEVGVPAESQRHNSHDPQSAATAPGQVTASSTVHNPRTLAATSDPGTYDPTAATPLSRGPPNLAAQAPLAVGGTQCGPLSFSGIERLY